MKLLKTPKITKLREEHLILPVKIGVEQTTNLDFNRFRYIGAPKVRQIQTGKVILANREEEAFKWFNAFKNANEYSDVTLHGYFSDLTFYIKLTDDANLLADSKQGVELLEMTLVEHIRLGKHSVGWARKMLSGVRTTFQLFGWSVINKFSSYPIFKQESTPTPAYSDNEIKRILKLLNSLFTQLYEQINNDLAMHINTSSRKKIGAANFEGINIDVSGVITKCFCLGYFLMSYYTWANSSCLLKLKRPQQKNTANGKWFSQSVEKKRAGKFVTIELGDNNSTIIPKHGLRLVERLLKLSTLVSPDDNRLFSACIEGSIRPLEANLLTQFTNWIIKSFNLKADNGWPLRLQAQRFSVTGSNRYLSMTGDQVGTAILLNNTPDVVRKHYSSGNEHDNNMQLQAISRVLEGVTKCKSVDDAINYSKNKMGIEVLPYEAFINKYIGIKKPEKVIIGTGCKDPFSQQSARYNKKHSSLVKGNSSLACADILKCFECENQVIIEEVDDIWCLLSFKETLLYAQYDHLDGTQYRRNFSKIISNVEEVCFRVSPKVRRLAERKLSSDGRHPLWPEGHNLVF
jgi:hypothetical protein